MVIKMIQREITYKNIFDYVLGVCFSMWMFFILVIFCNRFGILEFQSFSGKAVLFLAFLMPAFVLYAQMKIWRDLFLPGEFLRRIFFVENRGRAAGTAVFFVLLHTAVAFWCSAPREIELKTVLLTVLLAFLLEGLQETGLRGFLAAAFDNQLSFLLSAVLTGCLWGAVYFPLWSIEGAPWSELNFVLFLLFCVYQSILLNALYRMTQSVFVCVIFRTMSSVYVYLFDELIFGSNDCTVAYLAEMTVMLCIYGIFQYRSSHKKSSKTA